jgi:CO dehydrogenase/acetyl-CoA synthase gamma subunit (corrinoid Fe-S protein)
MNQPIQFTTKINHGTITIPQEYSGDIEDELEVEVIIKPKPKQRLMDRLAQNPIQAEGWRNLTREQIYDRD